MSKPKKDIQEIALKEFPQFVEECQALSVEELDARLTTFAKSREEVQDTKDADEGLEDAQAEARSLSAPYTEALKSIRLRSRYLIAIIKERGGK